MAARRIYTAAQPTAGLLPAFPIREWTQAQAPRPTSQPAALALEQWFHDGVTLAAAWRTPTGVLVAASAFPTASAAVAALPDGTPVIAGKALAQDPALARLVVEAASATTPKALKRLRGMLHRGELVHDGSPALTHQLAALAARVDGARSDAAKAAVWAARAALS